MLKSSVLVSACLFGSAVALLAMPHPVKKVREPRTSAPDEPLRQPAAGTALSKTKKTPTTGASSLTNYRTATRLKPSQSSVGSDGLIPTKTSIAMFEARVQKNARDTRSRVVLAALYMRWAKESHNHQALHKAEAQLQHVLKSSPDSLSALTQLCKVQLAQHKFHEALNTANQILSFDAKHPSGLASQGDALLELGEYDRARGSYERLARLEQNAAVTIRLAHLEELTGNQTAADKLIKQAHAEILDADATDRSLAWYELRLAVFHQKQGQLETAAQHFKESLNLLPDYMPALVGLARVEAAGKKFDQAESLLRQAVKLYPRPETMAELSSVLAAKGNTDEADDWLAQAHEQLHEESKEDPELHYREFSRFLSNHNREPEQALRMATDDLRVRTDIYAWDTFAWAQFRNKQFEAASESITKALANSTADAEIHFHAGLIFHALGQANKAIAALERSLKINPHFSIRFAGKAEEVLNQLKDSDKLSEQN